jgi:hypothetical protein
MVLGRILALVTRHFRLPDIAHPMQGHSKLGPKPVTRPLRDAVHCYYVGFLFWPSSLIEISVSHMTTFDTRYEINHATNEKHVPRYDDMAAVLVNSKLITIPTNGAPWR